MEVYSILLYSGSLPYILLFTQALNRVWFDVTIIDINISVQYNGRLLPDIILLTQSSG